MAKSDGAASAAMQFTSINPDSVRAAYATTAEQLRDLSHAWCASMNKTIDSSWDLAVQLPKCADPRDAMELYADWLSGRQESLMADTKALSELWMKACKLDTAMMMPPGKFTGAPRTSSQASPQTRMSAVPSTSSAAE